MSTVAKLMEGSELRTNLHLAEAADAKATSHAEDGWRARAVASLGLSRPEPSPMGPVRPVQSLESVSGDYRPCPWLKFSFRVPDRIESDLNPLIHGRWMACLMVML